MHAPVASCRPCRWCSSACSAPSRSATSFLSGRDCGARQTAAHKEGSRDSRWRGSRHPARGSHRPCRADSAPRRTAQMPSARRRARCRAPQGRTGSTSPADTPSLRHSSATQMSATKPFASECANHCPATPAANSKARESPARKHPKCEGCPRRLSFAIDRDRTCRGSTPA